MTLTSVGEKSIPHFAEIVVGYIINQTVNVAIELQARKGEIWGSMSSLLLLLLPIKSYL